jgi:hypothetical protein
MSKRRQSFLVKFSDLAVIYGTFRTLSRLKRHNCDVNDLRKTPEHIRIPNCDQKRKKQPPNLQSNRFVRAIVTKQSTLVLAVRPPLP